MYKVHPFESSNITIFLIIIKVSFFLIIYISHEVSQGEEGRKVAPN